ncbi:flagellar biosynthetic protein FliO [Pseudohaliea sp.]|uniref:flagellar biosynthetic protein FliO n=1 Tax=Pseudohaliea sp. TaxID=2740289 RepID=UPI0032EB8B48
MIDLSPARFRFLALAAVSPGAAAAPSAPDVLSPGYAAQVLGSLLLVLLCLAAVIWLLRRVNRAGSGRGGSLRVLATASVGVREKVVLLAAGDRQLLLGVAPGTVRTLHVFDEPVADAADNAGTAPGRDFAGLLSGLAGQRGAGR